MERHMVEGEGARHSGDDGLKGFLCQAAAGTIRNASRPGDSGHRRELGDEGVNLREAFAHAIDTGHEARGAGIRKRELDERLAEARYTERLQHAVHDVDERFLLARRERGLERDAHELTPPG